MMGVMWRFRACRTCRGDLRLDWHWDVGYFWVCVQCGRELGQLAGSGRMAQAAGSRV